MTTTSGALSTTCSVGRRPFILPIVCTLCEQTCYSMAEIFTHFTLDTCQCLPDENAVVCPFRCKMKLDSFAVFLGHRNIKHNDISFLAIEAVWHYEFAKLRQAKGQELYILSLKWKEAKTVNRPAATYKLCHYKCCLDAAPHAHTWCDDTGECKKCKTLHITACRIENNSTPARRHLRSPFNTIVPLKYVTWQGEGDCFLLS